MKKLNVTIQLEMSVPDDWSLVETSEGTPVLQLPDGTFMDLAIEPLFATNPEETWSSTDDDDVLNDVLDIVREDDFYNTAHQAIFKAMKALDERREPIDVVTLEAQLRAVGELKVAGRARRAQQAQSDQPLACGRP